MAQTNGASKGTSLALPLTEPTADAAALQRQAAGVVVEADNARLVGRFYQRVRADDLLGPIFARHIGPRPEDWEGHLPRMEAFWSTVVLHSGRYAGRPMEAHRALAAAGEELTGAHFERWLSLWREAVTEAIHPDGRAAFMLAARRMAGSIRARLN
ncbi:MAG: group III truncated hemoglobin [Phycisphaerales bacterium JB060]